MSNTHYLIEKLGAEVAAKVLPTLDEDDILNPDETLRRHKMGIDINYLVKYFGKGEMQTTETNGNIDTLTCCYTEGLLMSNDSQAINEVD